MEESISAFGKSLGWFCNHVQTSCAALKQSVDRRPIPLDSASSTFIQSLNRRVSSAAADLNLLESMSFGTVSFEELLGHCNEVFKKNQTDLLKLQDYLKESGHTHDVEIDSEDEGGALDSKDGSDDDPSYYRKRSIMNGLDEDPLMDDSLSLKSLGLSDVCLATLASGDHTKDVLVKMMDVNQFVLSSDSISLLSVDHTKDDVSDASCEPMKYYYNDKLHKTMIPDKTTAQVSEVCEETSGKTGGDPKPAEPAGRILEVVKDDFEILPSYMKSLTSWEDLLTAVEKINSSLKKREKTKGIDYFYQDEIASLGLGPKARTYLLLLVRMNQLVVQTIDGLISYKVL